jgi:hypothetical protein
MDFSFDAVVTAIEQFATPAPELIEGLLEAPQNAATAYEAYLDAGSPTAQAAGVNLDSTQPSATTDEAAALPGHDLTLSLDAALPPSLPTVAAAESALLASASSTRYLHELGAAEVGGNISLSMTPTTVASLAVARPAWQGETEPSGIGL